jgi:nucleoside-diphosphate-sugar epimerase
VQRALVIGSEGNVGKPLVTGLRNRGIDILEVDVRPGWRDGFLVADINHPLDLLPAFDFEPDVVFLLSAMVSRVTCEQASSLAITTNLSGVNNVIQLTRRAGAKLVFFSTSEVYGPGMDVMDEATADPRPNNRYGLSKLLGERLVKYEVAHGGLKAVTLRPFMIYDENEDLGDHRSAMIRFAYNLASGLPIEVHDGSARGWLHASDAVRAIIASATLDEYSVINIGHPDVVPIIDLANMIRQELGASPELITVNHIPEQMTLVKNPDLARMRELLGVVPAVSLEEGVRRVCTKMASRVDADTREPGRH